MLARITCCYIKKIKLTWLNIISFLLQKFIVIIYGSEFEDSNKFVLERKGRSDKTALYYE